MDPPLALVIFTTSWRVAGMRSSNAASSPPVISGAGNVELVIDAVVSAMADQHQHEGVGGLHLAR